MAWAEGRDLTHLVLAHVFFHSDQQGDVGIRAMNDIIKRKWDTEAPPVYKEICREVAKKDRKRYRSEMKEYRETKAYLDEQRRQGSVDFPFVVSDESDGEDSAIDLESSSSSSSSSSASNGGDQEDEEERAHEADVVDREEHNELQGESNALV